MPGMPSAKALYLCEETDREGDSSNLYALLDALRPPHYPYTHPAFVCFAQLRGAVGSVSYRIDVRRADAYQLIYVTNPMTLHFPNRDSLRQVAITIEGCVFEAPGVYMVELYCDNAWIADTILLFQEAPK